MTDSIQQRVHVVGCPRSGTTLMTELLRYAFHFEGAAGHEKSLFDRIPQNESPYLTKKPADTIRIGRAFEQDPQLHVIALIRDPRAVITSIHWSHPEVYFVGFARWKAYADKIQHYAKHPRYLVVRYEDLLKDPDVIQAEVSNKLPFLKQTRPFSDYPEGIETLHHHSEKALGGIRPFDQSRLEAWREHLGRVRAEYDSTPGFQTALEQFNYEKDTAWTECLDGVAPEGRSYKDAVDKWPGSWEVGVRYFLKTNRYLRERKAAR